VLVPPCTAVLGCARAPSHRAGHARRPPSPARDHVPPRATFREEAEPGPEPEPLAAGWCPVGAGWRGGRL